MSTPSPLQGVTWPLWLVFLCLTPSFLRLLSLAPFSSPCASLSLFLNRYENTKHRSGSSESQSIQHCTSRGGLWALFIENLVCEAVALSRRKEGRSRPGREAGHYLGLRGWQVVPAPQREAARWLAPGAASVGK